MKRIEEYAHSYPAACSAIVVAFCFLLLHVGVPVFFQEDDLFIANGISGVYNGTPLQHYPFISTVLSTVMSFLYRILPALSWYSIIMQLFLWVSCIAIHYSILICAIKRDCPLWLSELIFAAMFFMALLPMCLPISFTLIAGVCGVAASMLLFVSKEVTPHRFKKELLTILSALLAICSALVRQDSFLVAFCFYALTAVYCCISICKQGMEQRKRLVSLIIVCLVVVLGIGLVSTVTVEQENSEWNNNRSLQVDYAVPPYEDAEDIYQSVGWNKELFALEQAWYFADDGFCNESLSVVNSELEKRDPGKTVGGILLEVVTMLKNAALNPWQLAFTVILFLSLILSVVCVCKKILQVWDILYVICAIGGMLCMWAYLSFMGRFTFHVFRLTALQLIGILVLILTERLSFTKVTNSIIGKHAWAIAGYIYFSLFLSFFLQYRVETRLLRYLVLMLQSAILCGFILFSIIKHRKQIPVFSLLICGCLIMSCYLPSTVFMYVKASDLAEYGIQADKEIVIQQYARQNPEQVYIRSLHSNGRIITFLQENTDPVNLFCALDYLSYTEAYESKLSQNGLEELTIDSYFRDDVYYIGDAENDSTVHLLLAYMKTQYGEAVTVKIVENLAHDIAVYQFEK